MAASEPRLRPVVVGAIALIVAPLVAPLVARAQEAPRVGSGLLIYQDDDHVQVVAPRISGRQTVGEVTVDASAGVDIVTAASVDLVTAASPGGFSEERYSVDAGVRSPLGRLVTGRLWSGASHEPDFLSWQLGTALEAEVLDRQATASLGVSWDRATVGRKDDPDFARLRGTGQLDLGLAHVLGPRALLDLGYAWSPVTGYQANPYRYVRLYAAGANQHATSVVERTPNERHRHSGLVRWRGRLATDWFAAGQYRLHADTWGMVAHTVTLKSTFTFGQQLHLDAELRGHAQGRVDFYQRRYTTFPLAPVWRTADKELGPMWTGLAGVHLQWQPVRAGWRALRLGAGADVLHMRYLDFEPLDRRTALAVVLEAAWEP